MKTKKKGTDSWLLQPAKVSIAVVDCLSFIVQKLHDLVKGVSAKLSCLLQANTIREYINPPNIRNSTVVGKDMCTMDVLGGLDIECVIDGL